jgi:hypothetical protein
MEDTKTLNRDLVIIAWGVFFLWWGSMELLRPLHGIGDIGVGLILIGLNVVRSLKGVRTSYFTITLGVLALALGALELSRTVIAFPPITLPLFPILLILLGVMFLVRELQLSRAR